MGAKKLLIAASMPPSGVAIAAGADTTASSVVSSGVNLDFMVMLPPSNRPQPAGFNVERVVIGSGSTGNSGRRILARHHVGAGAVRLQADDAEAGVGHAGGNQWIDQVEKG